MASIVSGAALILCLSACSSIGIWPSSKKEVLGQLMVERLEWMDDVARVKKARSLPVNDPVREAQLLDAMVLLATKSDLPAGPVREFFTGQMEAAKQRQEEYLEQALLTNQPSQRVPDLAKTIRPALDLLGQKMVFALSSARAAKDLSDVMAAARLRLERAGYSNAVIVPALQGLEAGLSAK